MPSASHWAWKGTTSRSRKAPTLARKASCSASKGDGRASGDPFLELGDGGGRVRRWRARSDRLVTPASAKAAIRSWTYDAGPTRLAASSHSVGTSASASFFLPDEVEVLDLLGLLLVAVGAGHVVVEVLAPGAHAADVQREHRPGEVEQGLGLRALADRHHPAGGDLAAAPARPAAWRRRRGQRLAPDQVGPLGEEEERHPAVGDLGGLLDALGAERRDVDRDGVALGVGEDLQRLAEAGDGAVLPGEREL